MVYSGISQPQCIQLSEFSPNADDIDGVHYETLLHFNEDFVQIEDFLVVFYAENHCGLTSEEHTRFLSRVNAVRDLQNESLIDLVTLRDALSIWTPCNTEITQSITIHGFIDGFYTEKHRQQTAEDFFPLVNDVRIKSGHNLIALKSIRVAISTWKRVHPEIEKDKSVHDCIDDTYAERSRLPTTDELHSRLNEVRRERNDKSCKSCSQSSLLDQFQDRATNHVDGRDSYDVLIYYMFYVMEYKDP